jgi:hypothetical protein
MEGKETDTETEKNESIQRVDTFDNGSVELFFLTGIIGRPFRHNRLSWRHNRLPMMDASLFGDPFHT